MSCLYYYICPLMFSIFASSKWSNTVLNTLYQFLYVCSPNFLLLVFSVVIVFNAGVFPSSAYYLVLPTRLVLL